MIRLRALLDLRRSALLAVLAILLMALAGVTGAQDPNCPLGGYIDEETGGCGIQISITIDYPVWLGDSEAALTAVGTLLNDLRAGFLTDIDAAFSEYFTDAFLDVSYQEFEHGAALRSIVFTIGTYTGGAHPNSFYQSVTVDTIANRVLAFSGDIFPADIDPIPALQPLVVAALQEQQGEDADLEWINSGTDGLEDYTAWAIDGGSLVLFFAPYSVAPYAMGPSTVSIPIDDLASVINPMLIP